MALNKASKDVLSCAAGAHEGARENFATLLAMGPQESLNALTDRIGDCEDLEVLRADLAKQQSLLQVTSLLLTRLRACVVLVKGMNDDASANEGWIKQLVLEVQTANINSTPLDELLSPVDREMAYTGTLPSNALLYFHKRYLVDPKYRAPYREEFKTSVEAAGHAARQIKLVLLGIRSLDRCTYSAEATYLYCNFAEAKRKALFAEGEAWAAEGGGKTPLP